MSPERRSSLPTNPLDRSCSNQSVVGRYAIENERLRGRVDRRDQSIRAQNEYHNKRKTEVDALKKEKEALLARETELLRENELLCEEKEKVSDEVVVLKISSATLESDLMQHRDWIEQVEEENHTLNADNKQLRASKSALERQLKLFNDLSRQKTDQLEVAEQKLQALNSGLSGLLSQADIPSVATTTPQGKKRKLTGRLEAGDGNSDMFKVETPDNIKRLDDSYAEILPRPHLTPGDPSISILTKESTRRQDSDCRDPRLCGR